MALQGIEVIPRDIDILTAKVSGNCVGGFSGKVVVCGPTPYTCLKRTLIVVVNGTAGQQSLNSQD